MEENFQFGKKAWTNMPFHYIVPSPSTTLKIMELKFTWSHTFWTSRTSWILLISQMCKSLSPPVFRIYILDILDLLNLPDFLNLLDLSELFTLGFLAKISFTPLLYHPVGCLGCPEKQTSSRNYDLFVCFLLFFSQNGIAFKKTYKKYQNPLKSYCFLEYFQSLFNFGWKTAAQTN